MPIRTVWLSLFALSLLASRAPGLTLEAGTPAPARWATGRVLSAVADPSTRTTEVVLGDADGREVARFRALGALDGRIRWIAEGIPAFRVGDLVDVGLVDGPSGALLGVDADGEAAVRTPPKALSSFGPAPAVTDILPSAGGAVPDDPELVTVRGSGFGAIQNDSKVSFPGLFERVDAEVVSWADDKVVCRIPAPGLLGSPQVLTGPVKVWTADGGWSDGDPFTGGSTFSVLYQWAGDFWPTARLPIRVWVNPAGSPFGDDFATFAETASAQWNVPGSYARFVYAGLTPVEGGNHGDPRTPRDGRNTVIWRSTWQYDPNILALTWSAVDTLTLEREEVELEINGTRPWTTDPEGEPSKFDLVSTLTHEFGHWLRLGHTQRVPSVMSAFVSPGERRREISVGDGYGASWIHPSYGTVYVLPPSPGFTSVAVSVTAFDRQGVPRVNLFKGIIEARALALAESENPGELDPPLDRVPEQAVNALSNTGADGMTSTVFLGLPDGRYRIETYVEGHFVRPASIVRVGAAPPAPTYAVALSGVTPSPLTSGAHGRVRFTLPIADDVTLALYDARGRKVRTVVAGALDAGPHDVAFETTGTDGGRLRAGVYWLRLAGRSALTAATSRVVVLP